MMDITKVIYFPHPNVRKGKLELPKVENYLILETANIDLTGDVKIGEWCMIGHNTQIFTHDHFHEGRRPLLEVYREQGVKWKNKVIGRDVWLHGCMVLYQVDLIPDGVVIGAGSVLTKNPGPYEIWAGNPAVKIGERCD